MDIEKLKRCQNLKVIIAETAMVVTVILLVAILALLVSGYRVNSSLEVERQGMVQISSSPIGADIEIDSESEWLFRTNSSKVLSSGLHTIKLSKSGYDTWSKEINITEGLLYRLQYPQLFLQNRTKEKVLALTDASVVTISPDYNTLLSIGADGVWQTVKLNDSSPAAQVFNLSDAFDFTVGEISQLAWSGDSTHLLLNASIEGVSQWLVLDLETPKNSVNLSKEFNQDFIEMQIVDNSASTILAVQNGNLHKIDVARKQISAVLVKDVLDFDHLDDKIIFAAKSLSGDTYYAAVLDDEEIINLTTTNSPLMVAINEFYNEKYFTTLNGDALSVYDSTTKIIYNTTLDFQAKTLDIKGNGSIIVAALGSQIATLDMEAGNRLEEWNIGTTDYWWLNDFMLYTLTDGELKVCDYDGANARVLASDAKGPVSITNKRWLYYLNDGQLVRERIIE